MHPTSFPDSIYRTLFPSSNHLHRTADAATCQDVRVSHRTAFTRRKGSPACPRDERSGRSEVWIGREVKGVTGRTDWVNIESCGGWNRGARPSGALPGAGTRRRSGTVSSAAAVRDADQLPRRCRRSPGALLVPRPLAGRCCFLLSSPCEEPPGERVGEPSGPGVPVESMTAFFRNRSHVGWARGVAHDGNKFASSAAHPVVLGVERCAPAGGATAPSPRPAVGPCWASGARQACSSVPSSRRLADYATSLAGRSGRARNGGAVARRGDRGRIDQEAFSSRPRRMSGGTGCRRSSRCGQELRAKPLDHGWSGVPPSISLWHAASLRPGALPASGESLTTLDSRSARVRRNDRGHARELLGGRTRVGRAPTG